MEIFQRGGVFRQPELCMVPLRRLSVGSKQALALGTAALVIRIVPRFGNGHMKLLGQALRRLMKGEMLHLLNELDDIATRFAAEAEIQVLFRVHGEGRRFFMVERAQAPIAGTVFFQGDVCGDDLNDVGPAVQLIQPCIRKPCGQGLSPPFQSICQIRCNARFSCKKRKHSRGKIHPSDTIQHGTVNSYAQICQQTL